MTRPRLRSGSLFTGCGGLDLAADDVFGAVTTAWVCDIKPAAVAWSAHRHPDLPNLGDITRVDWARVTPVDLLTFGWPCQPFSSAGKRLGEEDPRALWPHIERAVQELRPRVLLGENVARVATNGELRRVVQALAALGYVGAWRCVTAAQIGAPHKRDRLALVGLRADSADAAADTRGAPGLTPGGPDAEQGARHRTPSLGTTESGRRDQLDSAGLTLLPTPHQNCTTGPGTSGRDGGLNLQTAVALLPTPAQRDARRGAGWGDLPGRPLSETVHRVADGWGVYAAAVHHWEQVLGREAPPPTVTSVRNGGQRLSPRFVEWMMGLPEGWVCDVPGLARPGSERNAQLSLLGDGVVPQQMAHGFRLALADLAATIEVAA